MGRKRQNCGLAFMLAIGLSIACSPGTALGGDLQEVRQSGVLRHLGVPYANFVTGMGDGLDVELIQLFARYLGVKYEYVETSWENVMGDLTGKKVKPAGNDIETVGDVPVKGDIIANGLTVLSWREKIVDYSKPTFPTQVWLVARSDSDLKPIEPSGDTGKDIAAVTALLRNHSVMGKPGTCLDPSLYGLAEAGARVIAFERSLNELAPAIVNGDAETTLLDVPDALIALTKWPGEIKVIGPVSPVQNMACAFAKTSPRLREAFETFLEGCMKDMTYVKLVEKYYPDVFDYYPDFFPVNSGTFPVCRRFPRH